MDADDLAKQGAMASAAIALTKLSQNVLVSQTEGLFNSLRPSDAYMRR